MNSENVDRILGDLRQHIGNLQDKNNIADKLINRMQNVNQTISTMKEYKEEVSNVNASWRSNNRNNLVASLQAENRTIISLQEENRQLKFSLEEMETALHLIMQKHRSLIVDFSRADKLMNLLQMAEKQPSSSNGKLDEEKFIEFLQLMEDCLRTAEDQFCHDAEAIARLRTENATLREMLTVAKRSLVFGQKPDNTAIQNGYRKLPGLIQKKQSSDTDPENDEPNTPKKVISNIEAASTVVEEIESIENGVSDNNDVQSKEVVDPEYFPIKTHQEFNSELVTLKE